ncbi:MAG: imidazole glycerol phosphate synthase subunit HisH [Pyrinomonadaceae bacterium]
MACNVVIVDYGTGNLSSVERSLARLGAEFLVSSRAADIDRCEKLILAGVGHFGRAMEGLRKNGLIEPLEKAVLIDRKPVLGICLGMELMARSSEEGNVEGLGWLDANVVKFSVLDKVRYKVPHIGWNRVGVKKASRLMDNIPASAEFYFLHSYHLELGDRSILLNDSRHEEVFTAAVEKENIYGVQYHPEKSHRVGLQLLKNFVDL